MNNSFRTLVVLLTVAGVCFTTSCKKNSVNGLVKTKTVVLNGGAPTTTVYTYDSQGRQIAQTGVQIQYNPNSVVVSATSGTPTTYTLNPQGYASTDNTGTNYSYDGSGFVTLEVTGTTSISNVISNGDVVSSTTSTNGSVTSTTIFTYLSNVDYRSFGLSFLGRRSTHVVNSETIDGTSYTFGYTYDSEGRVLIQTISGINFSQSTTYTY